jgi:hypothetical protein
VRILPPSIGFDPVLLPAWQPDPTSQRVEVGEQLEQARLGLVVVDYDRRSRQA